MATGTGSGLLFGITGSASGVPNSVYASGILALSPAVFLKLNDTNGTSATDYSGNNHHAEIHGAPNYSQPSLIYTDQDTAMEFDGVDDFIRCDTSSIAFGTDFGLSFSFNSSVIESDYLAITTIYPDTWDGTQDFATVWIIGGVLHLWVKTSAGAILDCYTSPNVINGQDTHIHIGYNTSEHYIYVNGVKQQITYDLGSASVTGWSVAVGGFERLVLNRWEHAAIYSWGDGNLALKTYDEVAIFNTALTDIQLEQLYIEAIGSIVAGNLPAIIGSATGTFTITPIVGVGDGSLSSIVGNGADSIYAYVPESLVVTSNMVTRHSLYHHINELILSIDSIAAQYTSTANISEVILTNDSLYLVISGLINEVLSQADSFVGVNNSIDIVNELISNADSNSNQMIMLNHIAELLYLIGHGFPVFINKVSESISVADTTRILIALLAEINELINQADTTNYSVSILAIASENVVIGDSITPSSIFNLIVSEQVFLSGVLNIDGDSYYTFVVNTKNMALSEYTNYGFTSMSEGLACNSEGVYRLNDDTDNEIIESEIKTGLMDFGTSKQKQVPYAYLGLTNDGNMALKTIATLGGEKKEVWYELTLNNDVTDTRRVQFGKGVKSKLWQFAIRNIDGSDFNLDSIEVLPLALARRI